MFEVKCPHCHVSLDSEQAIAAGTAITCPSCNSAFVVPEAAPVPEFKDPDPEPQFTGPQQNTGPQQGGYKPRSSIASNHSSSSCS